MNDLESGNPPNRRKILSDKHGFRELDEQVDGADIVAERFDSSASGQVTCRAAGNIWRIASCLFSPSVLFPSHFCVIDLFTLIR